MNRYCIFLSYKGSGFHGWQIQPNALTVQEHIELSLSKIIGSHTPIVGAGRTDTGVHAQKFYAHFDTDKIIDTHTMIHSLNKMLSKDVAIYSIQKVAHDFHARFSALSRKYSYRILRKKNPFLHDFSWLYTQKLSVDAMNKAAEILYDYQDFTSFSKLHTDTKTNDCSIEYARWEEKDDELLFTITANRFLRNMVRSIVGTLVEVGRGTIDIEDFKRIIEAKNRNIAGFSVPAAGLTLEDITYNWDLFLE